MKVGIIGAGTMGSGIAQAFAQTEGYEVMLCDINICSERKEENCRWIRKENRKRQNDSGRG